MGSSCGLHFDALSICDARSYVPEEWAVLFQESDRHEEFRLDEGAEPDDSPSRIVEYRTDRATFLWRLTLLGASDWTMQTSFIHWLVRQQGDWQRYAQSWSDSSRESAQQTYDELMALDFEGWKQLACEALHTRYQFDVESPQEGIKRHFHDFNDNFLFFDGYGSLVGLRALLEACPEIETVSLDVGELIDAGYYSEDSRICEDARKRIPFNSDSLGPTIILGEGSTDLRVLRAALSVMHPALVDYFSFFDHAEFSVDGGTAYLVKFLKAFAGARMTTRMVAVFDNDTAGLLAHAQAVALKLPGNFLVTHLPDTDLARHYPTIGPSGATTVDVNGSAAGIELYLGREALTIGQELRPIRWTGYMAGAGKYQGEVEGKAEILEKFLRLLAETPSPEAARERFPELAAVWKHIFDLVEQHADEIFLRGYEELMRETEVRQAESGLSAGAD